jgi:hypothetical protein
MAYTSGTASDYKDLLARMVTFAAANGWVVLEQTETQIYLKGTGLAGTDEIYCGVNTGESPISSQWWWELFGAKTYRTGRTISAHPGSSPDDQILTCFGGYELPYWMVANPRRIIVVARSNAIYHIIHLGLGDPFGTDAQYPYPLVIGGCSYDVTSIAGTGVNNAMFCGFATTTGSNIGSGWVLPPEGMWSPINRNGGTEYSRVFTCSELNRSVILSSPDGSYLLEEIYLGRYSNFYTFYGLCRLDGLYTVSGYNNPAGSIITVSGVNYLVFNDVYRLGYGDFFALRLT